MICVGPSHLGMFPFSISTLTLSEDVIKGSLVSHEWMWSWREEQFLKPTFQGRKSHLMKAGRRSGAGCCAGFEPLSLSLCILAEQFEMCSFQHNVMCCSYVTSLSFPTAVYKRKTNNSACWDGSSCSHSAVSAGQAFLLRFYFHFTLFCCAHSVLL